MKITAHDVEGVLGDVVLGDDGSEEWIVDPPLLPAEGRRVQITPLFRGANPFAWGRGNRTTSFSWTVARDHGSAAAAALFVRRHAAAVPINVRLDVDDGSAVDTYTGVMAGVEAVDLLGRSTVFRYSVQGAVLQAGATDDGTVQTGVPLADPTS